MMAMSMLFAFIQPSVFASGKAEAAADKTRVLASDLLNTITSDPKLLIPKNRMSTPRFYSFEAKTKLVTEMHNFHNSAQNDMAIYASARAVQPQDASAGISAVINPVPTATEPAVKMQYQVSGETVETAVFGLNADKLLELVNNHRVSIGLNALQKDDRVMTVATERAPELFDEIFINGNMHAGFYARNLPYHSTENIIYFNSEEGAYNWWMNSAIHRAAIENPEYTHTGIACDGNACSQIFANF